MAFSDFDAMLKSDLAFVYGEAGSAVVYGAYNTFGILTHEPTDILQMGLKQYAVLDTKIVMTIQTGSIGVINKAMPIMVDSVIYSIRSWIYINDGMEQQLDLSMGAS